MDNFNEAKFAIVDERISFISLCKSPKNKRAGLILKADNLEGTDDYNAIEKYTNFALIKKGKDESGNDWTVVYGILSSPYTVDSDGHTISQEEILKSAWNIGANKVDIDREHDFDAKEGVYIVENAVAKTDIKKSDMDDSIEVDSDEDSVFIRKGEHYIGVKVENEEIRKAVEDGDILGFSRAGKARLIELNKANVEEAVMQIQKSMPKFYSVLKKGLFNESVENDKHYPFEKLTEAIWDASRMYRWGNDDGKTITKDEVLMLIRESVNEFETYLQTNIKKSNDGGQEMTEQEIRDLIKAEFSGLSAGIADVVKGVLSEKEDEVKKAQIETKLTKAEELEKENTELKSELEELKKGLEDIQKAINANALIQMQNVQKSEAADSGAVKPLF